MSDPLRRAWLLVGWLLLACVAWQSLVPRPIGGGLTSDTLQHLGAYGLLSWWFGCAVRDGGTARRLRAAAGLVALGGGIELAQALVPPREPSVADALANGIGAALGAIAAAMPRLDGLRAARRITRVSARR